jgi:hypothetical protein
MASYDFICRLVEDDSFCRNALILLPNKKVRPCKKQPIGSPQYQMNLNKMNLDEFTSNYDYPGAVILLEGKRTSCWLMRPFPRKTSW